MTMPPVSAAGLARQSARPAPTLRPLALLSVTALRNALGFGALFTILFSSWVLLGLGGAGYYTTAPRVRGYHGAHALLRPSGFAGEAFGVAGVLFLLVPFVYMMRKRIPLLRRGDMKMWLEVHIFCGIAGPVVVTYHTAFKFSGIISVAFWSMITVAISGFVGRYLYVRIPRTIRGVEIGEPELAGRLSELKDRLIWITPPEVMDRVEAFERDVVAPARTESGLISFFTGGPRLRMRLRRFGRELGGCPDLTPRNIEELTDLLGQRAMLNRRLASLHATKRLFQLWHVFHLPLAYVMCAIVSLHVALMLYLGYVPFRQ